MKTHTKVDRGDTEPLIDATMATNDRHGVIASGKGKVNGGDVVKDALPQSDGDAIRAEGAVVRHPLPPVVAIMESGKPNKGVG